MCCASCSSGNGGGRLVVTRLKPPPPLPHLGRVGGYRYMSEFHVICLTDSAPYNEASWWVGPCVMQSNVYLFWGLSPYMRLLLVHTINGSNLSQTFEFH